MTDERIIELYWDRDESAVTETQAKYGRYLTKIAYNILADMEDSLESVNDTYMHAWKSMPPHRPNVLSAYLAKITRRVSIDILRKKSREVPFSAFYFHFFRNFLRKSPSFLRIASSGLRTGNNPVHSHTYSR